MSAAISAPKFTTLEARMAPLSIENIDTDQIIPAAYLKTTSRDGLGEGLFASWRGKKVDGETFVLDNSRFDGAEILVAGDNFGCGSSREHAPWALLDYGFRAVVSTRFADIFRSNSLKNGLLTVTVPVDVHQRLMATAEENPSATAKLDLERQVLTTPWGDEVDFQVDPFARRCLLEGTDALGFLQASLPQIEAYEAEHPSLFDTRKPRFSETAGASE